MKSRWNCGSMTCIICLTCVGSQMSINSSSASSFSGPVQKKKLTQCISVIVQSASHREKPHLILGPVNNKLQKIYIINYSDASVRPTLDSICSTF
uniref:Secreted protein n=1 Tax=Hippocampus comes TaxID=109280 RepID=A0A3Q2XJN7_HIPCM